MLAQQTTKVDIEAYRRDGFITVPGLLSREEAARLRARVDTLVAQGESEHIGPGQVQTQYNRQGQVAWVKVNQITDTDPEFQALSHHPEVVSVVEALLGEGARVFRDVLIVKPARSTGVISWHQDSAYWDVDPPSLVSCWVALTDVPEEASCLRVIPGTHDRLRRHSLIVGGREVPAPIVTGLRRLVSLAGTGDNPGAAGGNKALWRLKKLLLMQATRYVPALAQLQDYQIPKYDVPMEHEVTLPVKAGDAVFFHSMLLHATGPNTSPGPRYSPIISYMSRDAVFTGRGTPRFRPARRA